MAIIWFFTIIDSPCEKNAEDVNDNLVLQMGMGLMRLYLCILRWWSSETVAVVTGANKGIGYEIARQLAHNGLTTVITARDETRGNNAVASLKREVGSNRIAFHPLDVRSEDSATKFAHWLQQTYGGTDILVHIIP